MHTAADLPALRWYTTSRVTGARVNLYDATHPDAPEDASVQDERWVLHCLDHSRLAGYPQCRVAYAAMFQPWQWCEECKRLAKRAARRRPGERAHGRAPHHRKAATPGLPPSVPVLAMT